MELNSPGIYIENFLANCDNWNEAKRKYGTRKGQLVLFPKKIS